MIEKALQPKKPEAPKNLAESLDTSFITVEWVKGLVDFNSVAEIYQGISDRIAKADRAETPTGKVVLDVDDYTQNRFFTVNMTADADTAKGLVELIEFQESESNNFVMEIDNAALPDEKIPFRVNIIKLKEIFNELLQLITASGLENLPTDFKELFEMYTRHIVVHELMHVFGYKAGDIIQDINHDGVVQNATRYSGLNVVNSFHVDKTNPDGSPDQSDISEKEWEALDEASTEILARVIGREYLSRIGKSSDIQLLERFSYFGGYEGEIKVLEAIAMMYSEKTGIAADTVLASFAVGRIQNPHAIRDVLQELGIEDERFQEFLREYKTLTLGEADGLSQYLTLDHEWKNSIPELASRLGLR